MDVAELVKAARIGSERRSAQKETCAPFAAALYDVLTEKGLEAGLAVACHKGWSRDGTWYHSVVEHDGRYYDSLGEFNLDILRKRLKIHPSVGFDLEFEPDRRDGHFEEEDFGIYEFLLKAFRKAAAGLSANDGANTPPVA